GASPLLALACRSADGRRKRQDSPVLELQPVLPRSMKYGLTGRRHSTSREPDNGRPRAAFRFTHASLTKNSISALTQGAREIRERQHAARRVGSPGHNNPRTADRPVKREWKSARRTKRGGLMPAAALRSRPGRSIIADRLKKRSVARRLGRVAI